MTRRNSVIGFVMMAMVVSAPAYAQFPNLADLTGINIDIPNQRISVGAPDPVGSVQRTFEAIGNLPGAPLAGAIRLAQSSVGARYTIPPDIYQQLIQMGISDHTLRRATWSTNWSAVGSVMNLVANDTIAVTLDDVIIFRDPNGVHDPVLWSHELRHVDQYERLGVDRFAAQYTMNAWVLENEARDQEGRIRQALVANTQQYQYQAQQTAQQYAYFRVAGYLLYGNTQQLWVANPATGQIIRPATGRLVVQNGQYWAVDASGNASPAQFAR